MRKLTNIALASLAAFSLFAVTDDTLAQTRRSTTTTQQRNTSGSSSSQTRSTGSQSRSTGSQTRSSSSQTRSTGSQTRSSGSSSQVRSSSSQTRSTGSSSQVRSSSSQTRSTGTSSQVRSSGSSSQTRSSSSSSQVRGSSSSSQVRQSGNSTQVRGSESDTYIVKDVNQVDVSNQINRESSSDSQVRRSSSSSQVRQSGSSSQVRGSSSSSGQSSQVRSSSSSSVRSNTNVTKSGLGTVTSQMRSQSGSNTRVSGGKPGSRMNNADDFRINDHNVERIPPRDRGFMPYDRPGHFYDHHHPHCFGFRVEVLPPRYRVVRYFGVDYYIYNDVYYRPYHGHYIVCRPPFGVTITAAVADMTFAAVNFAYYNNVYRTYSAIDANNRYIDQQNRIIAQNNATILAQNNAIAMNPTAALSSYEIASRLGLVQSYAFADRNYFYQDGIFYIVNGNGQYQTIVPPAGALVQSLPEDYDIITLNGVQYYRVDDTVYRLTLVGGVPYLEVLGQMYGQMSRTYNNYGY